MSPLNVLSGAEVKNRWSYTAASPVCLHSTSYLVPRFRIGEALPLPPCMSRTGTTSPCLPHSSDTVAYHEAFHTPL
jgi:hypothetical protein